MDVPGDKLPSVATGALAAYLRETTAPQVPEQLRAAFLAAIDAGRLRSMLNKQMTLTPLHRPGALLLGDAFNMRYAAHLCCSVCTNVITAASQHRTQTLLIFLSSANECISFVGTWWLPAAPAFYRSFLLFTSCCKRASAEAKFAVRHARQSSHQSKQRGFA